MNRTCTILVHSVVLSIASRRLQQIIGTQRVDNMRPIGWKTLVDQLRFQYEERLIIIVNSRGLISVTHVLGINTCNKT